MVAGVLVTWLLLQTSHCSIRSWVYALASRTRPDGSRRPVNHHLRVVLRAR